MIVSFIKEFWNSDKYEFDRPFLYCLFFLMVFGVIVMYSSSTIMAMKQFSDPEYYLKKQIIWTLIALVSFFIFLNIPYKIYNEYALYGVVISILMLAVVFIPGVGKSVGTYYGRNFHRWISIGAYQFQPSEFSKITLIIYISSFFNKIENIKTLSYKTYIKPLIIVSINLALILFEPAFGTMFEILFVIISLIYLSGYSMRNLFYTFLAFLPLVFILIYKVGYRRKRIDIWLDPYRYRFDEGHQLVSSFKAFIDGGWSGNQIASGYSHRYMAYSHTDFVLATFVEDFGFIGFLILFSLFIFLLLRSVYLIKRVKNKFGFFLASGIFILISIQIIINTYVVSGIFPVTGISLPFISYGGSSILMLLTAMGIFLNITKRENLKA